MTDDKVNHIIPVSCTEIILIFLYDPDTKDSSLIKKGCGHLLILDLMPATWGQQQTGNIVNAQKHLFGKFNR